MALITIQNDHITVCIRTDGATLESIRKDGTEYLWQGDPAFWKRKDNNLFPCVGRQKNGHYRLRGRRYPMPPHGFCADTPFRVTEQSANCVRLVLEDTEQTRGIYPFSFSFEVFYQISANTLTKKCTVINKGIHTMHFGLGSHPGFQVPLGGEGAFTDWYLEFPRPSQPVRIEFDQKEFLVSGHRSAFPLQDGVILPLRHDLFDLDAVTLVGTPGSVTLRCRDSSRSVRMDYPQMPYLGLWHTPCTKAPFVCLEPWLSLPARSIGEEDLETQPDLIHLAPSGTYENRLTFTFT